MVARTPRDASPMANASASRDVRPASKENVRPCWYMKETFERGISATGARSTLMPRRRRAAPVRAPCRRATVALPMRPISGTKMVGAAQGTRLTEPPSWSTAMRNGGWPPASAARWSDRVSRISALGVVMFEASRTTPPTSPRRTRPARAALTLRPPIVTMSFWPTMCSSEGTPGRVAAAPPRSDRPGSHRGSRRDRQARGRHGDPEAQARTQEHGREDDDGARSNALHRPDGTASPGSVSDCSPSVTASRRSRRSAMSTWSWPARPSLGATMPSRSSRRRWRCTRPQTLPCPGARGACERGSRPVLRRPASSAIGSSATTSGADAVNLASRMESTGVPGMIQVAGPTWMPCGGRYPFRRRLRALVGSWPDTQSSEPGGSARRDGAHHREDVVQVCGHQRDHRVAGAVVDGQLTGRLVEHPARREHDLVDVAAALVGRRRRRGPTRPSGAGRCAGRRGPAARGRPGRSGPDAVMWTPW